LDDDVASVEATDAAAVATLSSSIGCVKQKSALLILLQLAIVYKTMVMLVLVPILNVVVLELM